MNNLNSVSSQGNNAGSVKFQISAEDVLRIIEGSPARGEIRTACTCDGSQKDTLSVNTETGVYHCFRCGAKGNAKKKGRKNKTTQEKAQGMYKNAVPATDSFRYLREKGVRAYEGVKEYQFKTGEKVLLIPVTDGEKIYNLGIIKENGNKRFLKGNGTKKGHFFKIKGNDDVYLCEGYATGASVHEATGGTVYIAFDSGNLFPVLNVIHKNHSNIIICADNDNDNPNNPGLSKAMYAAAQYDDVRVAHPVDISGSDFNDLARERGIETVRERIAQAEKPDIQISPEVPFKFWYEEENSKGGIVLKINRTILYDMFKSKGFQFIRYAGERYLVQIVENICKKAEVSDMQAVAYAYIDTLADHVSENKTRSELRETFATGINAYISESLNNFFFGFVTEPLFVNDTEEESYFFFSNGFAVITTDGVKLKKYSELPGVIWDSQKIDHEYTPMPFEGFSFAEFIKRVCTKPENRQLDKDRHTALIKVLGYLLHNHRTSYNQKAVIFSESSLNEDDDIRGRTGKGLLMQALGKLRKKDSIDGKNFKFDSQFAFQNVEPDTQILLFDDVRRRFDFTRLFSAITEGLSVEKKNKQRLNLPPEKSPKIAITTNYSIEGDSDSAKDRRVDMELYCYFSHAYKPEDEFKEIFFESWNKEKWNKFYSFMFSCVQAWLKDRKFSAYTSETQGIKRVLDETSRDFLDFCEESLPLDVKLIQAKLFHDFLTYSGMKEGEKGSPSVQKFGVWLGKWAKFKGYKLERKTEKEGDKAARKITISQKEEPGCFLCQYFNQSQKWCRCKEVEGGFIKAFEKCNGKYFNSILN